MIFKKNTWNINSLILLLTRFKDREITIVGRSINDKLLFERLIKPSINDIKDIHVNLKYPFEIFL